MKNYPERNLFDVSTEKLTDTFIVPTKEFGPVQMWFWHSKITKEGITHQLEKFKEQHITNFFIHPCCGISVEYLSDEFFELIRHAVYEAKRLDMHYWIYDELDWPSGGAGGLVFQKYPWARQKYLRIEQVNLSSHVFKGLNTEVCLKAEFLSAQLRNPATGSIKDATDKCRVTKRGDYTIVEYENKSMSEEQLLLYFNEYNMCTTYSPLGLISQRATRGYLDMLSPEAVSKYIEITHERYKKAIGEEFGKTVLGVFTDEPTTLYKWTGPYAGAWNDSFEDEFYKDHGYKIRDYFYALFFSPRNRMEKKVRYDYTCTLKRLYHMSFCGQIKKWCDKNNLIFTGHFGGEESLGGYVAQGDMQQEYKYLDIPGIDSIISSTRINENDFNVAGKLVELGAKYFGKNRILCETYTVSGTDFRFPEMKRVANRLMVLGVNMIQYMGAHFANADSGKAAGGDMGGYFNTLFPHYHNLNDYIASVSSLSASSVSDNRVLMFIPLCESLTHYNFEEKRTFPNLQRLYEDTVNALLLEGIGFDLVSEDFARDIKTGKGVCTAYGYEYDTVIFPSMSAVNAATAKLIGKLQKAGVKTVFINSLPDTVMDSGEEYALNACLKETSSDIFEDGNTVFIKQNKLPVDMAQYRQVLKNTVGHKILGIESPIVDCYITHRTNKNSDIYFIANDEKRSAKVYIDAMPGMKIYNAETKETVSAPVKSGRIELTVDEFGMIVIICDKASNKKYAPAKIAAEPEYKTITLPDRFDFTAEGGNMFPLSYEIFDEETGTWYAGDALNFPPYIHYEQGKEYKLRAHYAFSYVPKQVFLNLEINLIKSLEINSSACLFPSFVPLSVNTRRWSEYDCKVDITPYISAGDNIFDFVVVIPKYSASYIRPPFSFLTGDFIFDHKVYGETMPLPDKIRSGGWEEQGYTNFCGLGIYKTRFNLDGKFSKVLVSLSCDDVAEVYVGGKYAGTKIWHRDGEIDISKFAKSGENELEIRITSTWANLYGARRTVNGLLTPPTILYK